MSETPPSPAIEGWYTLDADQPHLIGSCCKDCGSYYFPKQFTYCKNPSCDSSDFDEVPLSRTGKIWSYTNACYQPPEPYLAADPFVPYAIAAVELEREKMVVLGQVAPGTGTGDLKAGMEMELVRGTLFEDDEGERVIWNWKPAGT